MINKRERTAAIVVTLLIVVVAYGLFVTGRSSPPATAPDPTIQRLTSAPDESAASTAQALARSPAMPSEVAFAEEALRIADKEMDLAFAYATRQMAAHPQPPSKEAQEIQQRLQSAVAGLHADSTLLAQLNLAANHAPHPVGLDDSLVVVRLRLETDQDEVDDAQEDLIHAGGDPHARADALMKAHAEASARSDSTHVNVVAQEVDGGLVAVMRRFSSLREKDLRMQKALVAADSAAARFEALHRKLDAQVHDSTGARSAQSIAETRQRSQQQKSRTTVEKRADNEHQLADVYRSWLTELRSQERTLAHRALGAVLVILAVVLLWLFSDTLLTRSVANVRMERRSLERLRVVARVTLQVAGLLVIVIVIFGTPSNLGTIIGLAGAGLTVALKDFIVSFVGWLVLMGRDGVRIGDLVEINGVTGEVVELGVFNTVLNETGNWTDAGHPTGRRVTFTNSYAIEGHYFNFSTSGRWVWDEVRIAVPAGKDPYVIVKALKASVEEATAGSAQQAEAEWRSSSRSPGLSGTAAAPTITIKPVMGGHELTIRYITHATDRYQIRSTLYHAAVEQLGEWAAASMKGNVDTPALR